MQWIFELFALKENVCKCDEFCDGGEKNADYGSEDDDGVRKMYVSSTNQIQSIASAIRQAGVKSGEPEVGGVLTVQFTGFDKAKQQPGRKPPKVYASGYGRPTDETRAKVRELSGSKGLAYDEDGPDNAQMIADLLDDTGPEPQEAKRLSLTDMKSLEDLVAEA